MAAPEIRAHAEVRLHGRTVGAVAELDSGRILFEYADDFRASGLEISPLHLPLSRRGPIAFDELRRLPAFEGLPGVLADALPDSFGNKVIRAWYAARGQADRAMSPVQRLLYVGERAIGALTFHPAEELPSRPAELQALEIAALVRDARRIVEGEARVAIPEIYRIGASAGGMRPKALVLYHEASGELRSANAAPREGDVPCLLKFDGVGRAEVEGELGPPQPFNRIEAAYASMARAAGLDVADVRILWQGEHAHLLVRRFDVDGLRRTHQHTLGGLLHVDYNDPGASSYEELFRTVLQLGMPHASLEQAYLRMLFNVAAVNQDDHVKNLSFHLDEKGRWTLAPAYDLTFARGHGYTARHQMRVRDKMEGITSADLLAVGREFGIDDPAGMLARVRAALARMRDAARETRLPEDDTVRLEAELARRSRELDAR